MSDNSYEEIFPEDDFLWGKDANNQTVYTIDGDPVLIGRLLSLDKYYPVVLVNNTQYVMTSPSDLDDLFMMLTKLSDTGSSVLRTTMANVVKDLSKYDYDEEEQDCA